MLKNPKIHRVFVTYYLMTLTFFKVVYVADFTGNSTLHKKGN